MRIVTIEPSADSFIAEAKRLEEGVLYYEHSHRIANQFWAGVSNTLGGATALLSAAAAGANIPKATNHALAIALSVATAVLAAGLTFFRPAERAANHSAAATEFNVLRGNLRRYYRLRVPADAERNLYRDLEALVGKRDQLVKAGPQYSQRTFRRARREILSGIFVYTIDEDQSGTGTSA